MNEGSKRLLRQLCEADEIAIHINRPGEGGSEASCIQNPYITSDDPELGAYVKAFLFGDGLVKIGYEDLEATFALNPPTKSFVQPWSGIKPSTHVKRILTYSRMRKTRA
jgi:hypothetical protein